MWNPWKHVRLAGAVLIISAVFFGEVQQRMMLVIIGLVIQYLGVVGGVDRVERLMDMIVEKKEEEEN